MLILPRRFEGMPENEAEESFQLVFIFEGNERVCKMKCVPGSLPIVPAVRSEVLWILLSLVSCQEPLDLVVPATKAVLEMVNSLIDVDVEANQEEAVTVYASQRADFVGVLQGA
jgi:hypothetical protein